MSQAKRRKPLSEKVKGSLKKKADGTKFFYGELAAVYRKGQELICLVVQEMFLWQRGLWVESIVT